MAKRPRRRTAAKIVTKREQGEVVAHARRLAEDPTILIPRTEGRRPGRFDRLERRLRRIAKHSDKPRRLRWAIRFGPQFTRAFATLLLVGHAGKAERMASMHTPAGDLKYAVRGQVSKRHLVAVQHFRHPEVRILGYRELAHDTNGTIWATADATAWTPAGAPPPDTWYDLVLPKLPITFTRTGNDVRCPHFVGVEDPDDPRAPAGVALTLAQGPTTFYLCRACAENGFDKKSLLASVATYVIGLSAEKNVTVATTGTPRDCVHDGDCAWVRHRPQIHRKTLERYRAGGLTETQLLEKTDPQWVEAVRQADERLLVAGDKCHGDDMDALLDAIGATGDTRDVVRRFLDHGSKVLIAPESSLNKVLEARWDAAPEVLVALHPDPVALQELLDRHKRSPPAAVIEEVLEARRAAAAMAGYPRYKTLPSPASLADRLGRAHRIGGPTGLTDAVDKELKRNVHKGLLWAALRIASTTQGREWQFPQNDQEAGEFLETPLRKLLEAGPDTYHAALAETHTLAGGAGDIPAPSGTHGGA